MLAVLIGLFGSVAAALFAFRAAKLRLKTPAFANTLGSFCVWASVFCLGGAYVRHEGPPALVDAQLAGASPYMTALKFFVLAVTIYAATHIAQRVWQEEPAAEPTAPPEA